MNRFRIMAVRVLDVIWGGTFTVSALYTAGVFVNQPPLEVWTISVAFIVPTPTRVVFNVYLAREASRLSFGNKTLAAVCNSVGIIGGALFSVIEAATRQAV